MSAPDGTAFETLIYTDCVPGQGLQGTAGLQFQARSPGADRTAMNLVQNSLLYEPPANWMRERRPVTDYPPSFAHTGDGLFATAAGVYLGREANGGREGNQLTHAVVTGDPASYGLVRPAQMFGAPFWTDRPAAGTECPPLSRTWEPGPFDIEAAQTFVAGRPRGAELLECLLSALQALGPDGRRVLFIGEDAAEVLRWISAATLLLPQSRAVGIGFKVFTTNPAYAAQPVVAVHPDWDSTSSRVGNDGGYAVFDLTRNEFSDVTVSEDASRRVRLLLDEDPYDVLDVVEQAGANGLTDPGQALDLAVTMVLRGPGLSLPIARVAVNWLRDTPATLLAQDRNVLVDKLVGNIKQWPEDVLLGLDEVARSGQIAQEWAPEVRLALISAELNRASRSGTAEDMQLPPLPPGVWTEQYAARCAELVPDELAQWRGPRPFEAVLRVAARFDLQYDVNAVPEAVDAFVTYWADNPQEKYQAKAWGVAWPVLRGRLNDKLLERIDRGRGPEVGDAWCDHFLINGALPEYRLYETMLAAKMHAADRDGRQALIKDMLVAGLPQGLGQIRRTAEALWQRTAPTLAEYAMLPELLPPGTVLTERVFRSLLRSIEASGRAGHPEVDLLRRLDEHGLIQLPGLFVTLLDDDAELRQWCESLPKAEPEALAEYCRVLAAVGPLARRVWLREIVEAMLAVRHPAASKEMVAQLPEQTRASYGRALLASLGKADRAVPAVIAFRLGGIGVLGPEYERLWPDELRHWLRKAGDKRRKYATGLVHEVVPRRQKEWAALVEDSEKSFWSRLRREKKEG
ncbi:hypothetical protein KOI35_32445 [Actinoplanes bogorensis]|uniref:Uncharacterized protein n=1 Tax=Paractinoplanes bogorensis TaxID=1610840 RepID=A0ABS5YXR5_9ACTN|nr:GTPase-associated protein 1-related protein [Actinoplanes bogorensis]MBU2668232.1 hypothetical protein [Actinoplanes bogorensis]